MNNGIQQPNFKLLRKVNKDYIKILVAVIQSLTKNDNDVINCSKCIQSSSSGEKRAMAQAVLFEYLKWLEIRPEPAGQPETQQPNRSKEVISYD
jgi:hypothetical protein